MYLSLGTRLAVWAHDNSDDIFSKAAFSTVATILSGAMTALGIVQTIKLSQLAKDEAEVAIAALRSQTPGRRAA